MRLARRVALVRRGLAINIDTARMVREDRADVSFLTRGRGVDRRQCLGDRTPVRPGGVAQVGARQVHHALLRGDQRLQKLPRRCPSR